MPEIVSTLVNQATLPVQTSALLPSIEQRAWRLVNHGLAWTMLGAMILALAGLCVLLGQAMEIIASSASGNVSGNGWGASSSGASKSLLAVKVLYLVAGAGSILGLIAFTTGLALCGALSPVRPARWLAFATLAAIYAAVYGIFTASLLYQPASSGSGYSSRNIEATLPAFASGMAVSALGLLAMIMFGQAALACLAHAWNDEKTLARIKWYLKCQFALPAIIVAGGFGCGLLLSSGIAMILITTAVNIGYVYLAVQLIRNIYSVHRTILWQLEPERAKAPVPPPPKPVIDPLAD